MLSSLRKGLEGSAKPAKEGDELDITSSQQTLRTERSNPTLTKPEDAGLSVMAKLVYMSLIVAVCVIFVKTRKDGAGAWRDNSRFPA